MLPIPLTEATAHRVATPRSLIRLRLALRVVRLGPLLILAILVAAFALTQPTFISERNVQNVIVQSSLIAAIALGELLVIITKGIDLSVGSVMALSTVMGVVAFHDLGWAPPLVILVILATGAVVGTINAVVYVKGRAPHPFVVTLAMMGIARGLALIISDGQPVSGMPQAVQTAGAGYLGPVPVPGLIVLGFAAVLWFFTTRQVWGRWIYAVGGDPDAAREVGIPVDRVIMSVYIISGLCAGLAGLLIAGRTNSGFPTAGNLAEMDAIAGVIIGGASFLGGRGSVVNAMIGAVIVGVIRNGLNIVGVNTYAQYVAVGLIILVAVQIDVLRSRIETKFQALEGRLA